MEVRLSCIFDFTVAYDRIERINTLRARILERLEAGSIDAPPSRRFVDPDITRLLNAPVDGRLTEAGFGGIVPTVGSLLTAAANAGRALELLSDMYSSVRTWWLRNTGSPIEAALLHIESQIEEIETALARIESSLVEILQQLDYHLQ
ncbi:MAG: hypothetical protein OXF79_02660 [Chloroflexi bacterium]|nr:hypothetical protein [Chloroflexota bacterium]